MIWQWWSGSTDEWYTNGPFDTREQAIDALEGDGGYVVEAQAPAPVAFDAEALLDAQYFDDNDSFDYDHGEPDRKGKVDVIAAADAELQALLDAWCAKWGHTFVPGNIFAGQRHKEWIEGTV